jgi:hypothetical protein
MIDIKIFCEEWWANTIRKTLGERPKNLPISNFMMNFLWVFLHFFIVLSNLLISKFQIQTSHIGKICSFPKHPESYLNWPTLSNFLFQYLLFVLLMKVTALKSLATEQFFIHLHFFLTCLLYNTSSVRVGTITLTDKN